MHDDTKAPLTASPIKGEPPRADTRREVVQLIDRVTEQHPGQWVAVDQPVPIEDAKGAANWGHNNGVRVATRRVQGTDLYRVFAKREDES